MSEYQQGNAVPGGAFGNEAPSQSRTVPPPITPLVAAPPPLTWQRPVICPYAQKKSHGVLWGCGIACLLVFVILPVCLVILLGAVGMFCGDSLEEMASWGGGGDMEQKNLNRKVMHAGTSEQEIAVIGVKGIIANAGISQGIVSSGNMCKLLRQLRKNDKIVAIVMDMDSPGGEIVATDEIHAELQKCRRKGMKIVTCMHSMGASGGYYLAAGGDWIVANRMTMTGSIGVIMSSYNLKGLADKVGIKPMVIKSGNMKDILSMTRDMTEEEHSYLQNHINESFTEFAKIVAAGRPKYADAEAVKDAVFADGRIVSGAQAVELGLVDELGGMTEAIAKAGELGGDDRAAVVYYGLKTSFWENLLELRAPDHAFCKAAAWHVQPGRLYFLAPGCLGWE